MTLSEIKEKLLDILFPPRCAGCLALLPLDHRDIFCPECRRQWDAAKKDRCRKCGQPLDSCWCGVPLDKDGVITSEYHLVQYNKTEDTAIKGLVYFMKRRKNPKVVDAIALEMYKELYSRLDYNNLIICHVPRSRRNVRYYGHDHALALASAFAELAELETANILIHKGSANQKALNLRQREENAKKSYQIINGAGKYIKDKNVILIDDILTTGASVTRCARLLKQKGAKRIFVFSIAKTV